MHYDRDQRSVGTGEVVFQSKQAAIAAITEYNGVLLDGSTQVSVFCLYLLLTRFLKSAPGKPMKIELTTSVAPAPVAPIPQPVYQPVFVHAPAPR